MSENCSYAPWLPQGQIPILLLYRAHFGCWLPMEPIPETGAIASVLKIAW